MQLFPVISLVVVEALDIGASILLLLLGGGRRWGRDSWCKRSPGGCVGRPGCWCSGHLFSPHRIQRLVNQKILQNVDDLIFLWEWVRDEVNYYDATPSWAWLKSSNNYFTNRYNEKRYFKKVLFPVLNGKSTFLICFQTNVDEIRSDDYPWEDLGTHQISSSLVGKLGNSLEKWICRLGQAKVTSATSEKILV